MRTAVQDAKDIRAALRGALIGASAAVITFGGAYVAFAGQAGIEEAKAPSTPVTSQAGLVEAKAGDDATASNPAGKTRQAEPVEASAEPSPTTPSSAVPKDNDRGRSQAGIEAAKKDDREVKKDDRRDEDPRPVELSNRQSSPPQTGGGGVSQQSNSAPAQQQSAPAYQPPAQAYQPPAQQQYQPPAQAYQPPAQQQYQPPAAPAPAPAAPAPAPGINIPAAPVQPMPNIQPGRMTFG